MTTEQSDVQLLHDIEEHMRKMWDARLLPANCWPVELAQRLTQAVQRHVLESAAVKREKMQLRLAAPVRKPLTDVQIDDLWVGMSLSIPQKYARREIARSVERAHGIKEA